MLRHLLVAISLVTMAFANGAYADDAMFLKENAKLVKANRAKAIAIVKGFGVETSGAMPSGGKSLLDVNHNTFLLNQMTFKQIASLVGAAPVETPVPTEPKLVDQNHTILMGNGMVCKSIAEKLGIAFTPATPGATVLETNHSILVANGKLLDEVAMKLKK